ncbi:MAG: mannose-6-phosphate isomerase [Blastopirellula sp.]|nr:MAG: mannose-6-phosphate isomerase [Blastopirellula sp.]
MDLDTPLQFQPLFQQYIWGGRRLGEVLNKPIGDQGIYAESWEVVDHGEDQSIVANGPLAGTSLRDLVTQHNAELFGQHAPCDSFPLLFKFLDAHRDLSVQVHPDDEGGAKLDPPDLGKTEAWVVLAAEPGSKLYAGLKPGIGRTELEAAIATKQTDQVLHVIQPQPGDCLFIPARSIHALGSGLLVAEIQQSSNTTFRLFDWNRTDKDGNSRQLHIDQSLETINFNQGPIGLQTPQTTDDPEVEQLVACDQFVLNRCTWQGPKSIGGEDRFHIVSVIEGQIKVDHPLFTQPLTAGQTMLIPAAAGTIQCMAESAAVVLDMFLPDS